MHVFHIQGFSGFLVLLLAVLSALVLLFLLPATFMLVLWNALVYEGLKGPEINLYQGALLWGFVMVLIKLIFKPEIQFQFQQMPTQKPGATSAEPMKTEQAEESQTTLDESQPSSLDKQN